MAGWYGHFVGKLNQKAAKPYRDIKKFCACGAILLTFVSFWLPWSPGNGQKLDSIGIIFQNLDFCIVLPLPFFIIYYIIIIILFYELLSIKFTEWYIIFIEFTRTVVWGSWGGQFPPPRSSLPLPPPKGFLEGVGKSWFSHKKMKSNKKTCILILYWAKSV